MIIYAVIDTNVLVSAMINPKSVPGQIITEALIGRIIPVLNDAILEEYEEVLKREKFIVSSREMLDIIQKTD